VRTPQHARILEHERDPRARQGGVQRQVGGAGFQDAEDSHHRVERALDQQPDGLVRPRAERSQAPGQEAAAPGELAIGEPLLFADQCHRIGRAGGLLLEQLVQAGLRAAQRSRGGAHRDHAISSFMISLVPA
jgi:hypothetical protein